MMPESGEKSHGRDQKISTGDIYEAFSTETQFLEYLANLRWKSGYVCPRCNCHHEYWLSEGRYQCAKCSHQVSVTAGTVSHKTHTPLTQWLLTFYFVYQDKRVISAVQLAAMIGTTYKTAWFMFRSIHIAMGLWDETHQLHGVIKFDDAYVVGLGLVLKTRVAQIGTFM